MSLIDKKKRLLSLVLLAIAFTFSSYAFSAGVSCGYTGGGNYNVTGADIVLQRGATIGTLSNKFTNSPGYSFTCSTPDSAADRDLSFTMRTSQAPVSGYTDVYPTNLPGVGVKYHFTTNSGNICSVESDSGIINSVRTYVCHILKGTTPSFSFGTSVQFVKIAEPNAVGTITQIPSVSVTFSYNNQAGQYPQTNMYSGAAQVNIRSNGCNVTNPNLTVPLNDHAQSDFKNVGYQTKYQDFNISLNCDAGTKYSAQITGNSVAGVNDTIALDNAAASTTAQGIGVRLTDQSDSSWVIGQQYALGTAASAGIINIPMRARYYQFQSKVTPGDANATATMTLTYQ
ncbi:fimbrial protein [Dryocola clanedunensis]